jgi:K+-sensing histidine kinase KdpD
MKQLVRPKLMLHVALGLFILFFVGWADRESAYNMNLSVLYYIPVALWAWNIGLIPSIFMAIICTIGWAFNDHLAGHYYSNEFYQVGNIGANFVAFQLIAIGVSLLQRKFEREFELNYRLRQTMTMLEKSVSEVRRLQGQPLTLCTITKSVKIGDEWIKLDQFLHDKLELSITESVSDEALAEMMARMTEYHEYHDAQPA